MVRRPLVYIAVSYAAGIALQHIADNRTSLVILAAAAAIVWCLLSAFLWTGKNGRAARLKRFAAILLVFFILGAGAGRASETRTSAFGGQTETIIGRVLSVKLKSDNRIALTIKAVSQEKGRKSERILVTVKNVNSPLASDLTGRVVRVSGNLSYPDSASNPGAFDYRLYLRSKKIYITMTADWADLTTEGSNLTKNLRSLGLYYPLNRLAVFRQTFENRVLSLMDKETGAMLCGILFGNDSYLDDDLKDDFRRTGIGHLLAVSGLHVGMVYGLLCAILRNPRNLRGNLPIVIMLITYAALSDFSASVVRAVFMITVHMVARAGHRRYDFLSCTCFCGLVMLAFEPTKLFSSGVQLSFAAVFSLCLILPGFESLLPKEKPLARDEYIPAKTMALIQLKKSAVTCVLLAISLQLGMTPVTVKSFHYISPISLLLNPPAIAIAGLIVPAGILLIPLVFLPGPAALFMAKMEEMLLKLLIHMDACAAGTPLASVYVPTPHTSFTVFYYIMIALLFSELGRNLLKNTIFLPLLEALSAGNAGNSTVGEQGARSGTMLPARNLSLIMSVIITVSLGVGTAADWQYMMADLIFVDVGQGDCAHLKTSDGLNILFDTGGSESFSDTSNDGSGSQASDDADDVQKKISDNADDAQPHALGNADAEDKVATDILMPYLLGNGVSKLDYVVLSHLHQDHCGALMGLCRYVKVDRLIVSAAYESKADLISKESGIARDRIIFVKAGDRVRLGKRARLEVLSPSPMDKEAYRDLLEEGDENLLSLVTRLEYWGATALFTGDIDSQAESRLVSAAKEKGGLVSAAKSDKSFVVSSGSDSGSLKADILKVAHHGSRYSTSAEFLEAVRPRVSVIQVGQNYYGHPTAEAMERIRASGSLLYRNDLDGAVLLRLGRRLRHL